MMDILRRLSTARNHTRARDAWGNSITVGDRSSGGETYAAPLLPRANDDLLGSRARLQPLVHRGQKILRLFDQFGGLLDQHWQQERVGFAVEAEAVEEGEEGDSSSARSRFARDLS